MCKYGWYLTRALSVAYLLLLDGPLLDPARGVEPQELALARRRLLRRRAVGGRGRVRGRRVRRRLPRPLARAAQEARARRALLRAAHRHRRHGRTSMDVYLQGVSVEHGSVTNPSPPTFSLSCSNKRKAADVQRPHSLTPQKWSCLSELSLGGN